MESPPASSSSPMSVTASETDSLAKDLQNQNLGAVDEGAKIKRKLEDFNWNHSYVKELPGDPRSDVTSREVIQRMNLLLPIEPIDFSEQFITRENVFYGLGYDSVSDDYKVVRMIQSKYKGDGVEESFGYALEIKVFSLKSNQWKRIRLNFEVQILFIYFYYDLLHRRGNGVLASNSLHWILPRTGGHTAFNTIIRFDLASDNLGVLNFPQDLYCEDDMDIGVLDGCLCLMCYSESSHVDVWILREYQGKWSKFITVPKPETVVSFEFVRPMIYSKDRSKILLELNNGKLVWFDLESKSFEALEIKGCEGPCNAEIVVSSLVLGCNGDPCRAQEKKIMQESDNRGDECLSKGFKLNL